VKWKIDRTPTGTARLLARGEMRDGGRGNGKPQKKRLETLRQPRAAGVEKKKPVAGQIGAGKVRGKERTGASSGEQEAGVSTLGK